MTLTKEHLRAVMSSTPEDRVEELRKILRYPVKEFDREGSRFWYLRPGESVEEAADTCPIAVGFYAELNEGSDHDIRQFLTSKEQQNEIYGHYTSRFSEQQPVMYLLLPAANLQGRVALILPTEGGLRQRQIQIFDWSDRELPGRLSRLQQGTLRIANRVTALIPQIDWVFYPGVKTAKKLAQLMAEVARRIEQAIPLVYEAEAAGGYLHKLFESFKKELLPTLKLQADNEKDYSFADIYAQTVAYGLFTARVFGFLKFKRERKNPHDLEPDFYRDNAWSFLPETNPFLRKLFEDISKQVPEDLGEDLVSAVSELLSVLRAAEMEAVLSDFEQKIGQEDIIIRFYEDFLKAYKPQMRERRGVYYTPEPVVSYMVRSVDILLKEKFGKPLGLADPEVMILDPACGTGTFLLWICHLIYQRFQESPKALTEGLADKSWSSYVKERLFPRIFGFELLITPYAIAHLKLSLFLEETGYQFDSGKRLGVYLTNTLDDAARKTETLFEEFIAQEADQAAKIKENIPIMVIMGNPPYSSISVNQSAYIEDLMSLYKRSVRSETSLVALSDDYIKFIRFAHHKIQKTGTGLFTFISNRGFTLGINHRGMREELLKTFSEIRIIDLHGDTNVGEKPPLGSQNENVFDIQQGVCISTFIRNNEAVEAPVKHKEIWGKREEKYQSLRILETSKCIQEEWSDVLPREPYYFFYPLQTSKKLEEEYNVSYSIRDIFLQSSCGIKTHRDSLLINFSRDEVFQKFKQISLMPEDEAREKYEIEDTNYWQFSQAHTIIKLSKIEDYIKPIVYRPFDHRYVYYNKNIIEKGDSKYPTMKHLLYKNMALLASRSHASSEFSAVFVSNQLVEMKTAESTRCCYCFPLYLYSGHESIQELVLAQHCEMNIDRSFISTVTNKLGYTPTAEAIFYYIYAIFHSPTYRTRYAEFLKIDFPRVPLTSSDHLFRQLAAYGEELVALHLMKSSKLDNTITQFCDRAGNRVVDAGHPKYQQGDVIINKKDDRFTGVPENVWNFYVGGYQVCQKWLKDRKGRTLSTEDIQHYQRIVVALKQTIELMAKIDAAIPEWPIQ